MTARQSFMTMVGVDAVCVLIALAAIIAHAVYHRPVGLPVFVAAVVTGFAAQIWFIVGLAKAGRLEKGL